MLLMPVSGSNRAQQQTFHQEIPALLLLWGQIGAAANMLWSQPYFSSSDSSFTSLSKCFYPRRLISSLLPRKREGNWRGQCCVSVFHGAGLVCHNQVPPQICLGWLGCAILPLLERTGQGMAPGAARNPSPEGPLNSGKLSAPR